MAKLEAQKARMTFSLAGKQRPNKPSTQVLDAIQGAVTNALGPGYSVNVYSGQENTGHRHGSNRHGTGLAADVHIVGPDGKTLNARENKQQMLDVAKAFKELGGMGIGLGTDYMGGNGIHLDMVEPGPGQDNAWGNIGNAVQGWLDGFHRGPIQAQLPDTMQAPQSFAQTQARDQALAQAFTSPTRGLDVLQAPSTLAFSPPSRPQTINPPQRFPGVPVGQVTRSPLDAIPASLSPAPVGRVERAPLGPVGQFTQPASPLSHPKSFAPPSNLAAAPVGQVTRGPALAPAVDMQALAAQHNQYRPSKVTQMPTVAGMPPTPAPTGLPAAPPAPATPLAHPISVPAALPPPAPVLAPVLAPPTVVKDFPVAEVPQAPQAPRATAYDVYNGLADTALDNTGKNTVSRDAFGNTTVTNQYGVTTGMTPQGNQTAYGGLPSLPGISGPNMGKFGSAVKGALPGLAGSAVGGLLAGPLGALVGAALVKEIASPGGLLSKQNVFDTNWFGNIVTNKPQGGLGFPSAPSMPSGSRNVNGFDSRADRDHARGISPAAARDIDRGKTGLF